MRITGKRCLLSALAVSGVLSAASAAFAQEDVSSYGTYASIAGGLNLTRDNTVVARTPSTANFGTLRGVTYDTGWNGTAAFGNKWQNEFRTEAELSYRHAGIDQIGAANANGSQKVWGLMGNMLYDIDTHSKINFSVGGGVGVGHASWHNVNAIGLPNIDNSDTNLQWQAIGEVGMPLSSQIHAFVDYRYITLYDNKFDTAPGARVSGFTDHSHNILVGLRYYFNAG